jgi:uncharacterized protein DUF3303
MSSKHLNSMKFLLEFNPPTEVKNNFETNPELQKKMMEALDRMKPLAGWFTLRRGFFVFEAESTEELTKKVAPFYFIFKTDPVISPAISMEEFGKVIGILEEEGKKIQH